MLRTPDRERAFAALDQGIVFEYAAGTKGEFLTLLGLSGTGSDFVDKYLSPAADNFEKALAFEPSLSAARLHLARVHMLQDRRSAAIAGFREAAAAHVPSVRYLAHLFLGAEAERRGAGNEAEALYRAALADLPAGQSLYLALAHLSDNRGNRGDANDMLASFRGRAVGNRLADPWWDYFNVDGIGFDAVTAWRTLRAEVLK
jgi:tetratricopeptide (TPR) repeat protein